MILAHQIKFEPNNKQVTYFKKASGVARFAYNWALSFYKEQRELDDTYKFNEMELRKILNSIKHEKYPWMDEVMKCAPQLAIKVNLNNAFRNFFKKNAEYPKFHKKGIHDSFALSNDQFKIKDNKVWIPKLGWVKMSETLRFTGKVISATISGRAGLWFISVQVEMPDKETIRNDNDVIGVDLGVETLVTLSNGEKYQGVKATKKYEKKLRRLQQSLSRSVGSKKGEKKSNNFCKKQAKISKLYFKIFNARNNQTHELTTMIVKTYKTICVEDLHVEQMLSDNKYAKYIADSSFYEFRRQLEYKANLYGSNIITADTYYPSSKICSGCGKKKESLSISERTYTFSCGLSIDRDINAAINLHNYALKII